jgi:predicted site-specific integrase-resolvase
MNNYENTAIVDRASDGLLTKRALAAKLHIAPRTLDAWMKKGHVPYLKVKKSVRFVFADVLKKLNEQYRVN